MKTKLRILTTLVTLLLGTIASQAVVIFQDSFTYPAGPLGTNNSTWFAPPGDPAYATNTGITGSGSGTVVLPMNAPPSAQTWALFTNGVPGLSIPLPSSGPGSGITNWTGTAYYFPSNGPVAALYASFTFTATSTYTYTNTTYYALFLGGTNFALHPRVYMLTNSAAPGYYRLAINNNSAPTVETNNQEIVNEDLAYGTTYYVVFKQSPYTGLSTLWVEPNGFPSSETVTSNSASPTAVSSAPLLGSGIINTYTTGTNVPSFTGLCGFGFHNGSSNGTGNVTIGPLTCGTTFADVVPSSDGSNPPFISIPPANVTNFANANATFSVVAGGDQDTIGYQWYGPAGMIGGATSSNYTITGITSGMAGSYYVVVTNAALPAGVTSSSASLTVLSGTALPTLTGPNNTTVAAGSSTSLAVTATDGGAPMTYQWYFSGNPIANQTNSSLSMGAVGYGQAGPYSVAVSNYNGFTNSSNATLTVTTPTLVTIAYLRSLLDNTNFNTNGTGSLFTVKGTNNTWENQTTAGNCEFNIQDGTGGLNIFWSGANASTNEPNAGAVVQITGPLAEFDGILEMSPVYGNPFHLVSVISSNGPLPKPIPLPFDPNILNNPTNMQKHLMSCYFVASNVFLDVAAGDTTFGDDANEAITNGDYSVYSMTFSNPSTPTNQTAVTNFTVMLTNQVAQTFTMFYNNHELNFIGATKPNGPCTIYGILSIHGTSPSPGPYTSGYEFVATRLADVIPALLFTNVVTNIVRFGDLATNTYTENVLQPGETLTMGLVASDPGGGTVTVGTPTATSGSWSAITGNMSQTASASFSYTALSGDAGSTITYTLPVTFSSSGFSSTYSWTIYVPTADEQNIRITEVLPYTSSNTNSPAYNPLGRMLPESNSVSYDQYVEFVNASADTIGINHWTVGNGSTVLHKFSGGESLASSNAAVVYGGPLTDTDPPSIPGPVSTSYPIVEPASTGNGLTLTGNSGVITLHDAAGNLVDRVAYPAVGSYVLNSNFNATGQSATTFPVCAYSRFPNLNSALLPQPFISQYYATPGSQYDGTAWGSPPTVPTGITGITTAVTNGTVTLSFTATPGSPTTLWLGNSVQQPFSVLTGGVFTNTAGSYTISNAPSTEQFYFITTP